MMLPARASRCRTSSRPGACFHCRDRCGRSRLLSYVPCVSNYFAFGALLGRGLSRCSILCRLGLCSALAAFLARRLLGAGSLPLLGGGFSAFAGAAAAWALRPAQLPAFGFRGLRPSRSPIDDDLQDRVLLAVALLAAIIVPAALLEDRDLVGLGLGDDFGARRSGRRVDFRSSLRRPAGRR